MPKSRWLSVGVVLTATLALALLAQAIAGPTVAVFLALTALMGGLAVLVINAGS